MPVAIIAAAAITAPVSTVRYPEHALHCSHSAADAGTNGAADHASHRTGDPVTFIGTLLRAADNALGVSGMG